MDCNHSIFFLFGLFVSYAYDDISLHKTATQSHSYVGTNVDANNAVDKNITTCMKSDGIGINDFYKTVWWKVDLGHVYSINSIHIQFKNYDGYANRQRGRFAGFSLYVSNTGVIEGSTSCYIAESHLPPLNFSTTCTGFGRYVIFYNERLNGVKYPDDYEVANVVTELCEVTVKGCNSGFYSSNCSTPCPTTCEDGICHIQSGACFNCKPGWIGIHCNSKCEEGRYGVNCSQRCLGHCKEDASCNHVTGRCDGGCDTGWTGNLCERGCTRACYFTQPST